MHELAVVADAEVLGSHEWLGSLLLWPMLPVSAPLSYAGWPSMLLSGVLWSFRGTRACSNFWVGIASPFFMPEVASCSFVRWLFGLASVASDELGDAAAIDEGGGGVSS